MNKFLGFILAAFIGTLPVFSLPYDFSSTKCIPLSFTITKAISTKKPPVEGDTVSFRSIKTVRYKGKLVLKKDDIVSAKIGTVITSGMNGFPAEIIIDNFEIPNVPSSKLVDTYSKTGQNRSLWVFPLKWALTWLPPTGSLTNFIKGGHAKIKPGEIITIYYYPEWK